MVSTWFPHRLSFIARAVLPNTLVSEDFCALAHHVGKRWFSFIARAVLLLGRSRAIAKHTGFRCFLWVGSSCWEEVALFHCKSCALSRSKPHYCQTHWFQRFFVGWLLVLGRGGFFHCKSCALSRSKPRYCQTDWFQMFFVELPSIGQLIIQQLHQHCLIFPHPPRKYNILLQCGSFKTPKLEKNASPKWSISN